MVSLKVFAFGGGGTARAGTDHAGGAGDAATSGTSSTPSKQQL